MFLDYLFILNDAERNGKEATERSLKYKNTLFTKSLKLQMGKDWDYEKMVTQYKYEQRDFGWSQGIKIVPVNLNIEGYVK